MKYIKQVENAKSVEEVTSVHKLWDDFDTELASAVMKVARGPTKKELVLYQEARARECKPMTGRAALWLFLQRYKIDRGQMKQVELPQQIVLEFKGDLEAYLDGSDSRLLRLVSKPDEDVLHALIEPQLRRCKALAPEFVTYDRAEDGDPEKTTEFLYNAARKCVARNRRMDNLASLKPTPKVAIIKTKPLVKIGSPVVRPNL